MVIIMLKIKDVFVSKFLPCHMIFIEYFCSNCKNTVAIVTHIDGKTTYNDYDKLGDKCPYCGNKL